MRGWAVLVAALLAGCSHAPSSKQVAVPVPDDGSATATADLSHCTAWTLLWFVDEAAAQGFLPPGYKARASPTSGLVPAELIVLACDDANVLGVPDGPVTVAFASIALSNHPGPSGQANDVFVVETVVNDGQAPHLRDLAATFGFRPIPGTITMDSFGVSVKSANFTYAASTQGTPDSQFEARGQFRFHAFDGRPKWIDDDGEWDVGQAGPAVLTFTGGALANLTRPLPGPATGTLARGVLDTQWAFGSEDV